MLSGNLDEQVIDSLVRNRVPADAFGVGTSLAVSVDVPALDMVYKLQQYAGKPRRKRSSGKVTWPGIKQVFRERAGAGEYLRDGVALHDEPSPGEPLLSEMMRQGVRCAPSSPLSAIREHCRNEMSSLPPSLRTLGVGGQAYPVSVSRSLQDVALRLDTLD